MTPADRTPIFLVVGNAVDETVTRTEDGATRSHAGGVGAIMARELARRGADVTLLTTALPGPALDRIRSHLVDAGVRLEAVPGNPPQREHAQVRIRCRRGEFAGASGHWARMGGLAHQIEDLTATAHLTLVSLNLLPADLQTALSHSRRLVTNATSPKLAPRLTNLKGQIAATLNTRELGAIRSRLKEQPPSEMMPQTIGANMVLLTKGSRGMTLYRQDAPPTSSPATQPPPGTDFVGAGDAATAGLAWALATGEDPMQCALESVTALLRHNADGYVPEQAPTARPALL